MQKQAFGTELQSPTQLTQLLAARVNACPYTVPASLASTASTSNDSTRSDPASSLTFFMAKISGRTSARGSP